MQEMQLILLEEKSKVDIDIPIVGDGKCLPVENNIELLLSWLVDNLPEITTTNKKH